MDAQLKLRVKSIVNRIDKPIPITPHLIETITCWEALGISAERNNNKIPRVIREELADRLAVAEEGLTDVQWSWFQHYQMK